ncbi:hypothetical protein [Mesomycoplasma ovipneumoniae]|uniref:hypothetical protein n=1 Tax=Mesomycoplasma ovipneumoniae TaxID=29562 RepID=UPI002964ACCD|nr:hypothetical protein [Mesomycoplasma ovipneumoniae]MDW2910750.1 hypothetical protein [Mesomycoplasma ovipneumoniae]MDW2917991.1 hypothetical protein [Mesomycoplasma ovipneumoniae]MDW2920620.1 hypothetical protein [Mesomycoplasma ovipneumoniae]MDW2933861.1 hypothetical protein [Mesomycoplasma ovipneumoniae]
MAILAEHSDLTKNKIGYFGKYWLGTPNFKNMLKASENTYFIGLKKLENEIINVKTENNYYRIYIKNLNLQLLIILLKIN